jgi:hypothetical protein
VPFAVHRCKKMLTHYDLKTKDQLESMFADNRFYVTCEADEDVSRISKVTGPDNLLVGTDYGHADTSTELDAPGLLLRRTDLEAGLAQKIVNTNAARFYAL